MTPPAGLLPIDATTPPSEAVAIVKQWVDEHIPQVWRDAADRGAAALREVRSRDAYTTWYPVFGASGLVVPTWAREHGGLGTTPEVAIAIDGLLRPYRLTRLNPLGLNNTAAALFAHGTEDQRRRFLPPMVRNEERWCQLFSEPGAGSDLASLATRAERDGDEWVVTGQKVWTTWATESDYGILLARTDPSQPKHRGITYFLIDLHQPGVDIRPLRQLTGEAEFNEVYLDAARVPDFNRVGEVNDGWRVSASTLASERQMISGGGSGSSGAGRIGGASSEKLVAAARARGRWDDPRVRQTIVALWSEEQIRAWTNARVQGYVSAGQSPGAAASIGKVHQAVLNMRIQLAFVDLLGTDALAWTAAEASAGGPDAYATSLPFEVHGMLRSRANSIEGGSTEVNKNILAERVLGLPRDVDQWHGKPWREVPRS